MKQEYIYGQYFIVFVILAGMSANESIYCGNTRPESQVIYNNQVEVTFISDHTVERDGFVLTYMLSE